MGEALSLKGFSVERVLSTAPSRKFAALLGRFADKEGQAVITLERKPFDPDRVGDLLFNTSKMNLNFQNAEYAAWGIVSSPEHSEIKCDIIHPATEKHIAKYEAADMRILKETPALYRDVTLPYILKNERGDRLQWVYNCLEKKKEVERLIYENSDPRDGFMLFPDMKWDQDTVTNLYCLALVNRRDIASIRDLTVDHVPMLRNVIEQGCQAIFDRYKVTRDKLRIYFHYPPTFYHLHIHFTHMDFETPASDVFMVETVIDNLTIGRGDYYQVMPMMVKLRSSLELYQDLSKAAASSSG